jgi:hypothetical protein
VLAVEFVPNEDRVTPPIPAVFAYMMLGSTPSADAYTASEFENMGRQAGFTRTMFKTAEPTPQTLVWVRELRLAEGTMAGSQPGSRV